MNHNKTTTATATTTTANATTTNVTTASASTSSSSISINIAIPISHNLSRSFMDLVHKNNIDLPTSITSTICQKCDVLLIPTITCQVRIRARSRHARYITNTITTT